MPCRMPFYIHTKINSEYYKVGGVAGHMAGHGKLGAAAGCAVGHHEAIKADVKKADAQAPSDQK
jgi:hypothetical protein